MDPELEFDREVYPLGLLPNAGVVVGVSQRMSFSACTEFPCFEPSPQAQTILHCLLRHLLQVHNWTMLTVNKLDFLFCGIALVVKLKIEDSSSGTPLLQFTTLPSMSDIIGDLVELSQYLFLVTPVSTSQQKN